MTTPASRGRERLAEWKALHHDYGPLPYENRRDPHPRCVECGEDWPCPTVLLIVAVEEALGNVYCCGNEECSCGIEKQADILAKIEEGR